MYKFIIFIAVFLAAQSVFTQTQNSLQIIVKNEQTKENITEASVSVKDSENAVTTDSKIFQTVNKLSRFHRPVMKLSS
jgi:hypothetical protein